MASTTVHLPAWAMEALLDLPRLFIVASLMLVPQPTHLAGIEIAVTALAIWALVTTVNLRSFRRAEGHYRARYFIRVRISHVVNLLYVGAGIVSIAFPRFCGCGGTTPNPKDEKQDGAKPVVCLHNLSETRPNPAPAQSSIGVGERGRPWANARKKT